MNVSYLFNLSLLLTLFPLESSCVVKDPIRVTKQSLQSLIEFVL